MTTTTAVAPTVAFPDPGPAPLRLIRSELIKIRSTNVWWLFGIGVVLFTALALVVWTLIGNSQIDTAAAAGNDVFTPSQGTDAAQIAAERQQFAVEHDLSRTLISVAAQIYTSGQFFGLMFVMLIGTVLITNEFFHQTATTTFLATPHRTAVILSKLATAMLAAAFFWIFTTVLSLATGAIFLSAKGYGTQLDQWPVLRAILFNGLAYALWGVLGVGLGVLIRSQIGAVLVGSISYVAGTFLIQPIVFLIYTFLIKKTWVLTAMVAWPAIASGIMISPEDAYPYAPDWWVGGLVLVGYSVLFGAIGTLITRRRDIS